MKKRKIAVAMSGGVDSSVVAALLVDQGEDVIGIMMRLWSDKLVENRCCSPADLANARRIAGKLNIPFYVLDAKDTFKRNVVDFFVEGYVRGVTPNPCVECNRHIRWRYLLDYAQVLGATHLATGHYAQVKRRNGGYSLYRAKDLKKDQSYVLSILNQEQLSHALFPIGGYIKSEVRALAHDYSLIVADRPESQDLCFIGGGDYRLFLENSGAILPAGGAIFSVQGKYLGEHKGLAFYTIGQRKGLGISAPQPLYVIRKDLARNHLIVGTKDALGSTNFIIKDLHWVNGEAPDEKIRLGVQVRYRAAEQWATLIPRSGQKAEIDLENPIADITPGQLAVFYKEGECLGGGLIQP